MLINVTNAEFNTILAALRFWQRVGCNTHPIPEDDISTNGGTENPLSKAEVDELCERINADSPNLPPIAVILDGGLVQDVISTDADAYQALPIYIIDYDTEGADDEDLKMIPQSDGSDSEAYMRMEQVGKAGIDLPEAIRRLDAGETLATGRSGRNASDTEKQEKAVRAAGWKLDYDHFWTRKRTKGEPDVTDASEGLTSGDDVFMRTAALAMDYDKRSTNFHVSIDYRTKGSIGSWSGMVRAVDRAAADKQARADLKQHVRGVTRIDDVTVR